jgi:N6-L-threonylcarbamoyladenine synthase
MKILAIETSCDETGIALLEASGKLSNPRFKVLKNLVSSQIKLHQPFGGVVPNLAKREHLKNLPILFGKILKQATSDMRHVDLITVTVGPGLEPALWTGIEFAKKLAEEYKKPLIGANHLEGHLYSFLLPKPGQKKNSDMRHGVTDKAIFPAIALIVSGGHTNLLKMDSFSKWRCIGETRDDAAGEAFDKVARMLELPYPGGPEIEKLAKRGDPTAIPFPRPMLHDKNRDFSFSGLKTAVLYYLRDNPPKPKTLDPRPNIAASFQQAAIDVLVIKTMRATQEYNAKSVILCGGVAANKKLRSDMRHGTRDKDLTFFVPEFKFNLDNAAMIGAAGYMAYLRRKKYKMKADGTMGI